MDEKFFYCPHARALVKNGYIKYKLENGTTRLVQCSRWAANVCNECADGILAKEFYERLESDNLTEQEKEK